MPSANGFDPSRGPGDCLYSQRECIMNREPFRTRKRVALVSSAAPRRSGMERWARALLQGNGVLEGDVS